MPKMSTGRQNTIWPAQSHAAIATGVASPTFRGRRGLTQKRAQDLSRWRETTTPSTLSAANQKRCRTNQYTSQYIVEDRYGYPGNYNARKTLKQKNLSVGQCFGIGHGKQAQ